jgi:hypothetical protein
MRSLPVPLFRLEVGVRWAARVLAALLVGLLLVPFVVNGIYDVVHVSSDNYFSRSATTRIPDRTASLRRP